MDKDFLKEVAAQLRKPTGEFGNEVAKNMNLSNKIMNLAAIDALTLNDDETLLEIGMANGVFVPKILSQAKNLTYIGIDYSEDMIAEATELNQQFIESGKVKFMLGSIDDLPIESGTITKLFTVNTIYFWEDVNKGLLECNRVLSSDGLIVIGFRPESCLKKYPSTQFNFNYYTIEEAENLLSRNGFEIVFSIHALEPETEILNQSITPEFSVIVGKVKN